MSYFSTILIISILTMKRLKNICEWGKLSELAQEVHQILNGLPKECRYFNFPSKVFIGVVYSIDDSFFHSLLLLIYGKNSKVYLRVRESLIIGEKVQPLADSSGCDISIPHQTMTFFLVENGRGLFSITFHPKLMQSQDRARGKTGLLFIPACPVLWEWDLLI